MSCRPHSYLMSMQTTKDVKEYLEDLLGAKAESFQREFLTHWHPPQRVPSLLGPLEGKILERPSQEDMVLFRGDGGGGLAGGKGGGGSAGGKGGGGSSKTEQTKKVSCKSKTQSLVLYDVYTKAYSAFFVMPCISSPL